MRDDVKVQEEEPGLSQGDVEAQAVFKPCVGLALQRHLLHTSYHLVSNIMLLEETGGFRFPLKLVNCKARYRHHDTLDWCLKIHRGSNFVGSS